MREAKFDVNDEILRPYFPLPQVMEGMFELVNKLFGIKVEAADGLAPIWNKDVRFFKISKDGKTQVCWWSTRSRQGERAVALRSMWSMIKRHFYCVIFLIQILKNNSLHETRPASSPFDFFFCIGKTARNAATDTGLFSLVFFPFLSSLTFTTTHTPGPRKSVEEHGWMKWLEEAKCLQLQERMSVFLWHTWFATSLHQLEMPHPS